MTRAERAYIQAINAERDQWVRAYGTAGWQAELNRRRAARIARSRKRRHDLAARLVLSELGGQVIHTETRPQYGELAA